MYRRLRVPFEDLEAFRREYQAHIARGGLFVPTLERFEPRELVEVELELRFCDASPVLEAEVVRHLRPPGRSLPGVALHLLESTPQLRARLEALTGVVAAAVPEVRARPERLRARERSEARLELSHGIGAGFLETSLAATHARPVGRIEGDLSAMNLPGLIQMLPSSANEGTLVIRAPEPGRIGCVLFRQGMLAYVSLGRLRGAKALCRLLSWQEGRFEYTPEILAVREWEEAQPLPLPGALLEALQHHDELETVDRGSLRSDAVVRRVGEPEAAEGKLESQLLALLDRPRRVGEIVDRLAAYDVSIYRALLALLDEGAIELRSPPRA